MNREDIIYFVVNIDKYRIVYMTMIQKNAVLALQNYKRVSNYEYRIEKRSLDDIYYGQFSSQIIEGEMI